MLNEPLTNARQPEQSDAPAGGIQISNAVKDLAPFTVPRYTSAAARNVAFGAWVTAGGTMVNGMLCSVLGEIQVWSAGSWQPLVPGPTIFIGYNAGDTGLTSGEWTAIPLTLEAFDSDNGHSTTTNPQRWVAQKARWYMIGGAVSFSPSTYTGSTYRAARITINGSPILQTNAMMPVGEISQVTVQTVTVPWFMNIGDTITLEAFHGAPDAVTTFTNTNFTSSLRIWSV